MSHRFHAAQRHRATPGLLAKRVYTLFTAWVMLMAFVVVSERMGLAAGAAANAGSLGATVGFSGLLALWAAGTVVFATALLSARLQPALAPARAPQPSRRFR